MNLTPILTAVQNMLNSDPTIQTIVNNRFIERSSYINLDPNRTPWIGIYKGRVVNQPRTLGYKQWESVPSIRIVAQAANLRSAQECEDELETIKNAITDVIENDITLQGTVDIVSSYEEEYGTVETDQMSIHFQSVVITLNLEVDNA